MRIDKIISVTFIIFRKNILFYLHTIYKVNKIEGRKMIGSKVGFFTLMVCCSAAVVSAGLPASRYRTSSRFLARQEEAPVEASDAGSETPQQPESDGYHYGPPAVGFEDGMTTTVATAEETTTESFDETTTVASDSSEESDGIAAENLVEPESDDIDASQQSARLEFEPQPAVAATQTQFQQQYQPFYFLQFPATGYSQRLIYLPVGRAAVAQPTLINPQVAARAPPPQPADVEVFQPLADNPATAGVVYNSAVYQQSW
jgi:hypothetical protein